MKGESLMQPQYTLDQIFDEIPYGYCKCGCGQKTPIATYTDKKRNIAKGQPVNYIHGHNSHKPSLAIAFASHVTPSTSDECWIWTGSLNLQGYGRFGHNYRDYIAHRVSYELHYGPIPEGMVVCHKCDNPPCVNPAHLFLGTHADNVADMVSKGRNGRGIQMATPKLNEAQVLEIRALAASGMNYTEIARRYPVTNHQISEIARGAVWREVGGERQSLRFIRK